MNDDYIILRDEDGKAYIAHAGWLDNAKNAVTNAAQQVANKAKGVGRGVRQNHKYILKVLENGKTRYFYKQEEVKAYYEAKKRGIKNPAEYAQKAADAASNVVDAVKNVGNAAKSAFREATGQAARDRMDTAAARRDTEAVNMHNANTRRQKAENDKAIAEQKRTEALSDIKNARTAQRGLQEKMDKDADRISAVDRKTSNDEYNRRVDSWNLSKRALDTQRQKEMDGYRRENSSADKIKAAKKEIDSATSEHTAARDAYQEADSDYNKNKAAYDKSLAGAVDRTAARARDVASGAREAASSAYNKAKDSANNTVTNAKNRFERMKSEFRDKAEQAGNVVKSTAQNAVDKSGITARKNMIEAQKLADELYSKGDGLGSFNAASMAKFAEQIYHDTPLGRVEKIPKQVKEFVEEVKAVKNLPQLRQNVADYEKQVEDVRKRAREYQNKFDEYHEPEMGRMAKEEKEVAAIMNAYLKSYKEGLQEVEDAATRAKAPLVNAKSSVTNAAQGMIDKARSAVKDTAEKASDSIQGMIDNARSSTAKAVNEAWDKIPKNADGTVNPFDKNFQSTYNDWKTKKDKYDSSLAGRAKDAAEKVTDSVQDMIDKAKKAVKGNSASDFTREQEQTNTGSRQTKRTQEEINEMRNEKSKVEQGYDNFIETMREYGKIRDRIARHGLLSAEETQFNDRLYGLEQDVLAGKITPSEAVRKAEQMEEEAKTLKKVTLHR